MSEYHKAYYLKNRDKLRARASERYAANREEIIKKSSDPKERERRKAYNDAYGHLAGDQVLRAVGTQLKQEVRTGDSVYRYGGEEFLCILPEQTLASGISAAERIRAGIEGWHRGRGRSDRCPFCQPQYSGQDQIQRPAAAEAEYTPLVQQGSDAYQDKESRSAQATDEQPGIHCGPPRGVSRVLR